jgi:hypothetical protein
MATTNGALTPPAADSDPSSTTAPTDASANKRKRDDEGDGVTVPEQGGLARSKQIQNDILELLRQHDTVPSFLEHDFESAANAQPAQKKARLSDAPTKTTIADKLSSGSYTTLTALKDDSARVCKDVESGLRAKTEDVSDSKDNVRLTVEDLKRIQRAKAFEDLIKEVVDKENSYYAAHAAGQVKKEAGALTNGHVPVPKPAAGERAGTVLTLFGNAPTPKQLFSSMQNPPDGKQDPMIKTELPIEEMSLPNGLTATKVVPAPSDDSKKGPTFEDSFAPPYNLPSLHPPKAHKRAGTRDNATITWEFKDPVNRASRKGGYTVQSMTTGDWLGYGGVDAADGGSSKEKRKQRERALSSGAESGKEPPSKTMLEEQQAREEEALFRRAYSSFAPSHDNARSVIPAELRSMIWWHKIGAARYNDTFALDSALLDSDDAASYKLLPELDQSADQDADFGRVIEQLDDFDEDMADVEQVKSKTDVEDVLHQVSELLETLASHQRIRNASLSSSAAPSRTPISPAPMLASRIGKPDEPAEDEINTYRALRRELAYLILKLPPYAVAKLDGEQLAELGVSTLIPITTKNVRGTMEEDSVARLAKHNAAATAAGIASLTRSNSSTSGQHYSTTAQRTPAIGQAANTRYGQTSQYQSSRTPATQAPQYQRSTSSQSTYGTPSAAGTRPSYGTQPNQYTKPGAPQHSYSQSNGQQYYQSRPAAQPPAAGYYGTQTYQSTPSAAASTQPRAVFSSTPQPTQQQQQAQYAQRNAVNAVAYQTNASTQQGQTRTASPANVQPRPVYPATNTTGAGYAQQMPQPTSGRATPQKPVNGFARPPPPAVAPANRVGSGTPQPNGV